MDNPDTAAVNRRGSITIDPDQFHHCEDALMEIGNGISVLYALADGTGTPGDQCMKQSLYFIANNLSRERKTIEAAFAAALRLNAGVKEGGAMSKPLTFRAYPAATVAALHKRYAKVLQDDCIGEQIAVGLLAKSRSQLRKSLCDIGDKDAVQLAEYLVRTTESLKARVQLVEGALARIAVAAGAIPHAKN